MYCYWRNTPTYRHFLQQLLHKIEICYSFSFCYTKGCGFIRLFLLKNNKLSDMVINAEMDI